MKYLKNNNGFSLVELIIVIALMGIAITIVGLSIKNVNYANLDSYAEQFQSDLRSARDRTLYALDKDYYIVWEEDVANTCYSYTVMCSTYNPSTKVTDVDSEKKVEIHKGIKVYNDDARTKNAVSGSIKFDNASGSIEFYDDEKKIITGEDERVYVFYDPTTNDTRTVTLIKATGRGYLDE